MTDQDKHECTLFLFKEAMRRINEEKRIRQSMVDELKRIAPNGIMLTLPSKKLKQL